jgi:hypothetical protein
MDILFKIIEDAPDLVINLIVVLGENYTITIGKNYLRVYLYYMNKKKYNTVIRYYGSRISEEYKNMKIFIDREINNDQIKYIEGYVSYELKDIFQKYGFEYSGESPYAMVYKLLCY